MLTLFLFAILVVPAVFGGTPCPPREDIHPCSCHAVRLGKNTLYTTVSCHRLPDSNSLAVIFSSLRKMQIDQFYLYDSFWEAHKLGVAGESKKVLPTDWFTLLKIKSIEIVDTTLASSFACQWKLACRNSVTTRFAAVNSSSSEKISILCDTGRQNKLPWTGCLNRLREFHFSHGKLTELGFDFFPQTMKELMILNLTYNQIVKVEKKIFANTPRLISLDLSHNAIQYLDNMFDGKEMNLEFLDVSWNMIQTIGPAIFPFVPHLKTFKADNNLIVDLKESDWKKVPIKLYNIDLRENPLHCDCNIRWINSTFHINVVIQGTCATPEDYENSQLRRASRYLNERCDEDGNIGTRKRVRSTTPTF